MISSLFHTFFYNPIYNALVALVALVPGSDVGVAVILITILIRLLLLPFSLSAARTQRAMKELEPKLKELKEKYKNDKEREAVETLELYKAAKVNPFASILTAFIQIPVLLALYWVFYYEPFPAINHALLYAITPVPHAVSLLFLGLISVSQKSLVLAFFAGLTQYIQARFALAGSFQQAPGGSQGFQKMMGVQMQYVFPILICVISYTTSSAIALYFITTNIVGALQERHVRKVIEKETATLEREAATV